MRIRLQKSLYNKARQIAKKNHQSPEVMIVECFAAIVNYISNQSVPINITIGDNVDADTINHQSNSISVSNNTLANELVVQKKNKKRNRRRKSNSITRTPKNES